MQAGRTLTAGYSGEDRPAKESTSFLKKRSKKLLSVWLRPLRIGPGPNSQKFFGSFFQKRTAFFLYPSAMK
jgi:hypothetical protein